MSTAGAHLQMRPCCSGAITSSSAKCAFVPLLTQCQAMLPTRFPLSGPLLRSRVSGGKRERRDGHVAVAALDTRTDVEVDGEIQIEGLDRDYCTDFVCTSSPAVEQTVRALARDLLRQTTWTFSLFTPQVTYKDPFRSFKGVEKYGRLKYAADCVKDSKILVTKLQMLDRNKAEATWRMRGTLGVLPLDITFRSVFMLDPITGRVVEQQDSWDLSRCSLSARAAFLASRLLWSARQVAQDAKEGGSKVLNSISRMDDGDQPQAYYKDPTDPTKFFQQEDNTMQDAFLFAAVLALFYVLVNAWQQLAQIH